MLVICMRSFSMKKPIKPRKPTKPAEPAKPEKMIFVPIVYYPNTGTPISQLPQLILDHAKRVYNNVLSYNKLGLEDILWTEDYDETFVLVENVFKMPNDHYDFHMERYKKECEKYQKKLKRYEQRSKEYSEAMKIYHSDLEKYKKHIESEDHKKKLEEYHKLKKELNL